MKNGRCGLHGGLSTGPRTEDGLARLRAARTRDGFESAACRATLRRVKEFIAAARALVALQRAGAGRVGAIVARGRRLGGAGGAREWKARAGEKSLCNMRNGAR